MYARPDEDAIVTIATQIYRDGPNPHFFVYPTLYLYLVAFTYELYYLALSIGGQTLTLAAFMDRVTTDPAPFFLLSRIAAATLGTATVPVLFYATRRLFDTRTAIAAAALLAAAFLHVRDSHFGVTDIPATFMATLAFWAIVSRDLDRNWQHVFFAGVLCGLAGSTKYNAMLMGLPLLVRVIQVSPRSAVAMSGVALCGMAVGFLAGTPFAVVELPMLLAELRGVQTHFVGGHGADLGYGWTYHLLVSLRYGLGALVVIAALAGALWLAISARPTAIVALAFPVAYYVVVGAGRTVFLRYIDPILPFGCMLAAVAVARIAARAENMIGRRGATALATILVVVLMWPSAARSVAFDRLISQRDNRLVAAEWLQSAFPADTRICQTGTLYGRLQSWPAGRFPVCVYDGSSGTLRVFGSREAPHVVVIHHSPLAAYPGFQEDLMRAVRASYRSIRFFPVEQPGHGPPPVYDEQDAFFAPLDGFDRLSRPGPAFEVF